MYLGKKSPNVANVHLLLHKGKLFMVGIELAYKNISVCVCTILLVFLYTG